MADSTSDTPQRWDSKNLGDEHFTNLWGILEGETPDESSFAAEFPPNFAIL